MARPMFRARSNLHCVSNSEAAANKPTRPPLIQKYLHFRQHSPKLRALVRSQGFIGFCHEAIPEAQNRRGSLESAKIRGFGFPEGIDAAADGHNDSLQTVDHVAIAANGRLIELHIEA